MINAVNLQDKNTDELVELIYSQQAIFEAQQKTFEKKLALQQQHIEYLYEQIRLAMCRQFGKSSEKFIDKDLQGCLFDESSLPANEEAIAEIVLADEEITIPEHTRKKGRKALPKELPREQVVYDLPESERICACGCTLTSIGDVRTEQLDIIPAKIVVIEHIQKKYACKSCEETIKTAPKAAQPIPKSIAAPGLLANVLTQKFQFHLPLYRQEQMLQAIGVDIPRATLSLWVIRCAELLQPLVNLLQDEIFNYDVAYADESTVQVLKEKDKTAESTSYMWVFAGGQPGRFSFIYQYFPNRKHDIAVDFFSDFKGYMHCDGYQAYDNLAIKNKSVIQVGCWYHVRRKFVDAAKVSKNTGMADWYLKQIQRLAKIEEYITEHLSDPEKIKEHRNKESPHIIHKIKEKLDEQVKQVPPQSPLGKAIAYTLSQWPKLQIYLQDGRLEISNNRMERAMKPFAVGRKNWLFCNSVEGAKAAGVIYSLIETCKAHDVNCYEWLRATLTKIPACQTLEDFEALLPFNFKNQKN